MRPLLFTALLLASAPAFAQHAHAELDCKPGDARLTYDCTIRLSQGGKALEGAEVSVGADMPSMPMAHNVKPVKAVPSGQPGEYRARLELEMKGEWAVKLRLSGAVRDQIIVKRNFE